MLPINNLNKFFCFPLTTCNPQPTILHGEIMKKDTVEDTNELVEQCRRELYNTSGRLLLEIIEKFSLDPHREEIELLGQIRKMYHMQINRRKT